MNCNSKEKCPKKRKNATTTCKKKKWFGDGVLEIVWNGDGEDRSRWQSWKEPWWNVTKEVNFVQELRLAVQVNDDTFLVAKHRNGIC